MHKKISFIFILLILGFGQFAFGIPENRFFNLIGRFVALGTTAYRPENRVFGPYWLQCTLAEMLFLAKRFRPIVLNIQTRLVECRLAERC